MATLKWRIWEGLSEKAIFKVRSEDEKDDNAKFRDRAFQAEGPEAHRGDRNW